MGHHELSQRDLERFRAKQGDKTDAGCIPWLGRVDKDGYGMFDTRNPKRLYKAHRLSWEIEYERPFPDGMLACHMCDNPVCTNAADHIYPGTASDNMRDRADRGRQAGGHKRTGEKENDLIMRILKENRK